MDSRAVVDSETSDKYLRIASISIALYDYVITLPAEWRFYRSQSSIFHLSTACVLFILIRYVSIVVMLVSNYGDFATNFTQETCQHYYMIAPIFKVLQTMVSQVILGVRTWNISRRNRRVGITLALLFFTSITLEWFTNMFDRIPVVVDGNCTPGNSGKTLSAWLYYVIAMMYDLMILAISTTHLLQYDILSSRLERVVRVLIFDGIGYMVVLTGSNILNISAGASVGYAVTWIMSQRILIHLREMQEVPRMESVVLARPAQSARNVITGFRSKSDADFVTSPRNTHTNNGVELDIRVHVERSVVVDYTNGSEHSNPWDKVAR
ncbi:uncharacterized protein BJ212DRAFT_267346 [Suillus subaureus]|uniref:DUF6533 domain-containing protein n=1 Tax=Suillus subaureus TaxID=48587 RepID=A0A9P7E9W6_9AGAM|nr:uncharacterized protein BJ212DRAFT_267346 [Suillus subaureus]KAG1815252.1 hypothetical protein BJ212DRAFT_267346 [Suillus subaureus]